MAIGYSPLGVPGPATLGRPDIGAALRSGFDTYSKGYEAAYKPRNLQEALLEAQLKNAHQRTLNKYDDRREEARIGSQEASRTAREILNKSLPESERLRLEEAGERNYAQKIKNQFLEESERARIDKLKAPAQLSGEMAQLFALRNSMPAGPDREKVDQIIKRKAEGSAGTQLTVDPETGAISFSQGGSRTGPQSATTTDENGNIIQITRPTAAQSTAQQKASLSEIGRSAIAEQAEMPYVGTGANAAILSDRLNYSQNSDKEAGKRLVKAAVAQMIAPEYAGFQLASQGIQATIPAINHQYETIKQGWPKSAGIIVDNLPPELQKEAKKEHAKLLASIKKSKEQHAAKGYPVKLESNKLKLKYNIDTGRLE